MQLYKKLSVWRKAHELALRVFRVTAPFYRMRQSYLAGQMRRSAASIPANIADGTGRSTSAQFAHFLQQALRSARDLDYHLQLSRDLELLSSVDHATLEARVEEVTKMLVGLRRTVASRVMNCAPPRESARDPTRIAAPGRKRGSPSRPVSP